MQVYNTTLINESSQSDSTNFEINVNNSVKDVDISATTFHAGFDFVDEFGPRNVKLKEGTNTVQLKVSYNGGNPKLYTITINRGVASSNTSDKYTTPIKNTIDNIVEEVVKVEDTLARNPVIVVIIALILSIAGLILISSGIKKSNME